MAKEEGGGEGERRSKILIETLCSEMSVREWNKRTPLVGSFAKSANRKYSNAHAAPPLRRPPGRPFSIDNFFCCCCFELPCSDGSTF